MNWKEKERRLVKEERWGINESLDSNEFRLILETERQLRMEWKRELRFTAAAASRSRKATHGTA